MESIEDIAVPFHRSQRERGGPLMETWKHYAALIAGYSRPTTRMQLKGADIVLRT